MLLIGLQLVISRELQTTASKANVWGVELLHSVSTLYAATLLQTAAAAHAGSALSSGCMLLAPQGGLMLVTSRKISCFMDFCATDCSRFLWEAQNGRQPEVDGGLLAQHCRQVTAEPDSSSC